MCTRIFSLPYSHICNKLKRLKWLFNATTGHLARNRVSLKEADLYSYWEVTLERPRTTQNNCPITLFTNAHFLHSIELFSSFLGALLLFLLPDKLCVDFAWHISPLCHRAKRCHVGYFCKKAAVSALSKRMLPSCKIVVLCTSKVFLQEWKLLVEYTTE